jgi:hypothetical protein
MPYLWTSDNFALWPSSTDRVMRKRSIVGHSFCRQHHPWRCWLSWIRHWVWWFWGGSCYKLDVLCKHHRWIHPGSGHPVNLRHAGGFEAQCGMTGWGRGVDMSSWSPTKIFPANRGQLWGDTGQCNRVVTDSSMIPGDGKLPSGV